MPYTMTYTSVFSKWCFVCFFLVFPCITLISVFTSGLNLLYPRREAGILWIHHRCRPRPCPRPQRFLVIY